MATAPPVPLAAVCPRILIVDDDPNVLDSVELVLSAIDCRQIRACNLSEAQAILEKQPVELLVVDVNLPDGLGTQLLSTLRRHQPHATAIVITGAPDVKGAVSALQQGAIDFVFKPFINSDLAGRISNALKVQSQAARNERRVGKLRDAVRRLNEARKVVAKKVDLLCNDLISAYGEVSKQLDIVRAQEGYRHFLNDVADLEQLLCHTMDYLMRQMGYSNIAIWLAGDEESKDNQYQLGAYMKYTLAGEGPLVNALKRGVVRLAARDNLVHLHGDELQEKLTPAELDYLADQDVLAINCTYLGETLAVVVLFRDGQQPFTDSDVACLKSVSPLFAVALAGIVRDGGSDEDDNDADDDDCDGGLPDAPPLDDLFAPPDDGDSTDEHHRRGESSGPDKSDNNGKSSSKRRRKKRDEDWWKHGGTPPF